mgnify:CR=1 FL=1
MQNVIDLKSTAKKQAAYFIWRATLCNLCAEICGDRDAAQCRSDIEEMTDEQIIAYIGSGVSKYSPLASSWWEKALDVIDESPQHFSITSRIMIQEMIDGMQSAEYTGDAILFDSKSLYFTIFDPDDYHEKVEEMIQCVKLPYVIDTRIVSQISGPIWRLPFNPVCHINCIVPAGDRVGEFMKWVESLIDERAHELVATWQQFCEFRSTAAKFLVKLSPEIANELCGEEIHIEESREMLMKVINDFIDIFNKQCKNKYATPFNGTKPEPSTHLPNRHMIHLKPYLLDGVQSYDVEHLSTFKDYIKCILELGATDKIKT